MTVNSIQQLGHLKDGGKSQAIFSAVGTVPIHLHDPVKKELQRKEEAGSIEPVSPGEANRRFQWSMWLNRMDTFVFVLASILVSIISFAMELTRYRI